MSRQLLPAVSSPPLLLFLLLIPVSKVPRTWWVTLAGHKASFGLSFLNCSRLPWLWLPPLGTHSNPAGSPGFTLEGSRQQESGRSRQQESGRSRQLASFTPRSPQAPGIPSPEAGTQDSPLRPSIKQGKPRELSLSERKRSEALVEPSTGPAVQVKVSRDAEAAGAGRAEVAKPSMQRLLSLGPRQGDRLLEVFPLFFQFA